MIDLYATLGIKRDADHDTIRKAYRKLSKKYHPDMPNGDAEKFAAVAQAHDVLTDERQKAHYDRTGEFLGKTPEGNPDAEMYSYIAQCATAAINEFVDQPGFDLVKSIKGQIAMGRDVLEKQRRDGVQFKMRFEKALKRVKVKKDGDENILSKLLQSQITAAESQIATVEFKTAQLKRAEEFIDAYGYDVDKGGSMMGGRSISDDLRIRMFSPPPY